MSSAPQKRSVLAPEPLLAGDPSLHDITAAIAAPVEMPVRKTPIGWTIAFLISLSLLGNFLGTVSYLVYKGIGIWGNNQPVGWAWDITNFVWWIGIGHAGTLISAILLLFQQKWRTSINRFAETMTLFSVMMAGLFPLLHMGRPWFFYWMLPYPSTFKLWPQFRSALVWDVF